METGHEAPEGVARSDGCPRGIAHTARHYQRIACVLVEELVRLGVERVGDRVPDGSVDADNPPTGVPTREGTTKAD